MLCTRGRAGDGLEARSKADVVPPEAAADSPAVSAVAMRDGSWTDVSRFSACHAATSPLLPPILPPTMHNRSLAFVASTLFMGSVAAQWIDVSPAGSPPARSAAGMACNPGASTLLLFGGVGGAGAGTLLNDTWTYDGTTWAQLFPPTSPTAKFAMDIVYDSFRGVYVMYGGNATYTTPGVDQTWEFYGGTWTQAFPTTHPGNLGLHAMVFDSARNRVVLYGGMPGGNPIIDSNKTWEYDGNNWALRTTVGSAGALEAHSMCFHAATGKTVLFGGVNANPSVFPPDTDKTWAYDGTTWTELIIVGSRPPRRERARMAYDSVRQVCVLTGGMHYSNGQPRHDTWELSFNGTSWSWTQVATPTAGRFQSTLAFLPSERHMIQFGGQTGSSTYYGDTKEFGARVDPYGAGCAGSNGTPSLSVNDAPRLGQSWTVTASNLNPSLSLGVLVFGVTQLPGIDLGPILDMPSCLAFTTPDASTGLSGAGGVASWQWPAVGGAIGDTFYCQALCYDPGVNGFGFTISNALRSTLGS